MPKPKIAIYAISKNEEKFAARFAATCAAADYTIVLDTGSTDDTVNKLYNCGVTVYDAEFAQFRFDEARNMALALVPKDVDICIALDLDEVLPDGWRDKVENAWKDGVTKLWYNFVWSWTPDGKPAVVYNHSKIHSRFDYRWASVCHEYLTPIDKTKVKEQFVEGLEIWHYPDPDKPRGSYLKLLKLQYEEHPTDTRSIHYYGRELVFQGQYVEAKSVLKQYFDFVSNSKVYDALTHKYLAIANKNLGDIGKAERHWELACVDAPDWHEPLIELVKISMDKKDWMSGVGRAMLALNIKKMSQSYYSDTSNWDVTPYDLGAVCAYYAELPELARTWMKKALELRPTDPRLIKNAEFIL